MICFSLAGEALGEYLIRTCLTHSIILYKKSRYLSGSFSGSVEAWTKARFAESDALVFIGACGIAVRSIAPCLKGKASDPAVLVVDEQGRHVISLVSGHLGGANALTVEIAGLLHADPVITTATDLNGYFAVDEFARKNNCAILDLSAAKAVSAALLQKEPVGFYSDFPIRGRVPKGLTVWKRDGIGSGNSVNVTLEESGNSVNVALEQSGNPVNGTLEEESSDPVTGMTESGKHAIGVTVTFDRGLKPFETTAVIVPRLIAAGIGCKRNTDPVFLEQTVLGWLGETSVHAIRCLASIDAKKDEEALVTLAEKWGVPFLTFSSEELMRVPGEFRSSEFVFRTMGVDNVCERSAVLASGGGKLLQRKRAGDGVTLALAAGRWEGVF